MRPGAALGVVAVSAVAWSAAGCATTASVKSLVPPEQSGVSMRVIWRRILTEPKFLEYKPQEFASAATDGKLVWTGSHGGHLWALRNGSGEIAWRKAIPGGISSRPLFLADTRTLYVGGDDGTMRALDPNTGAERWVYKTKGPIGGTPVYEDGLLYFANGENRVYAIDAQSGVWRWQYERETPESFTIRGIPSPLVHGGRVYAGFADGYLASLNARTGDVVWARSLAGEAQRFMDVDATPVVVDGVLYVASYSSGVYALEPRDGSVKWQFRVEGATSVRVEQGRVYFAATRGGLYCLDTEGRLVWRQALAAQGALSAPVLLGDRWLLLSASVAGTYLVDRATGQLLQFFSPGQGVTSEATSDGRNVFVLTNTGFLYAIQLNRRI